MSRHETEMHRQRHDLLRAVRAVAEAAGAKGWPDGAAWTQARLYVLEVLYDYGHLDQAAQPGPLFETERQMDFADRTDLKREG